MDKLRYPIGEYSPPARIDAARLDGWITAIEELPAALRAAVAGLADPALDTPYRSGGWTSRQVVHHVADSHMNAYVRFKLALTEENPVIRPYREERWAELPDSQAPLDYSLPLIEALHRRWGLVLRGMGPLEFQRTYFHPEYQQAFRLDYVLGLYAWHGAHHVAHITSLRARAGW